MVKNSTKQQKGLRGENLKKIFLYKSVVKTDDKNKTKIKEKCPKNGGPKKVKKNP